MRQVPLTLDKTTLDPEEALKVCDENTICIVPILGVTWTGLNDDVQALDAALDAYNAKTGFDIPIHHASEIVSVYLGAIETRDFLIRDIKFDKAASITWPVDVFEKKINNSSAI